jgi:hypothetical protein
MVDLGKANNRVPAEGYFDLTGENQYTPSFLVPKNRSFEIFRKTSAGGGATVTLQRAEDLEIYKDENGNWNDSLANWEQHGGKFSALNDAFKVTQVTGARFRLAILTGDYTSGTISVFMSY